jgi:hypothetical protein
MLTPKPELVTALLLLSLSYVLLPPYRMTRTITVP